MRGIRAYRSYAAFSLLIDGRLCDFSQSLVGSLFLFESFFKKRDRVFKTKFFSPGDQSAITGDLVVFDGLCGGDSPASSAGEPYIPS